MPTGLVSMRKYANCWFLSAHPSLLSLLKKENTEWNSWWRGRYVQEEGIPLQSAASEIWLDLFLYFDVFCVGRARSLLISTLFTKKKNVLKTLQLKLPNKRSRNVLSPILKVSCLLAVLPPNLELPYLCWPSSSSPASPALRWQSGVSPSGSSWVLVFTRVSSSLTDERDSPFSKQRAKK